MNSSKSKEVKSLKIKKMVKADTHTSPTAAKKKKAKPTTKKVVAKKIVVPPLEKSIMSQLTKHHCLPSYIVYTLVRANKTFSSVNSRQV